MSDLLYVIYKYLLRNKNIPDYLLKRIGPSRIIRDAVNNGLSPYVMLDLDNFLIKYRNR